MTTVSRKFSNIYAGRSQDAAQTLPVRNPANGEVVGLMPVGTLDDLNAAVSAARAAASGWANRCDSDRQELCMQIAEAIGENSEELAMLLTLEQGKPLNGFGSRWEIGGAQAWCQYTAGLEIPVEVLQDDEGARVELHRQPIGVIGSITPWNFPVMIAVWHLIPAIRAGNTAVIKPSPNTPLATIRLVELINDILPAGVVNIVCGDVDIGAAISQHRDIDKMVFTGSTNTGKEIMASAAGNLKRLTLELGGNDAAIVLPDVDVGAIAEGVFWGAMLNSGQTCACIKRLYVHDDVYEALCLELTSLANGIVIGDG
ncbi:aldehyde dehydrogenase family protein, partial [Novosphingobium pentaromativorans]|uniref:aldehyde dehydrogenase family protein n=1 Tax=Novosphingobium pentaromativorans TaxID=205844 RepID=UPI00058706F1